MISRIDLAENGLVRPWGAVYRALVRVAVAADVRALKESGKLDSHELETYIRHALTSLNCAVPGSSSWAVK